MNSEAIEEILDGIEPIDIRSELFAKGDYDFIVSGENEDGVFKRHEKQAEALKILCDKTTEIFVYGGAAGGAKSWTGASWLLFMCILFPNTRWFIARNELKAIVDSCYVTFQEIAKIMGFTDYKYNANKSFVRFGNGSQINFIEIKYKPSDPMFEDLGSVEYTGGWIEEAGEVHEKGANVLMSRVGRWKNTEYGIKRKIFVTCNPKKNWLYYDFYKPSLTGGLPETEKFLQAFITDNPFIPKDYVNGLIRLCEKDSVQKERLLKGNWDYEDNPDSLCDYEMVEQIFSNDQVPQGRFTYLTADIARLGSDLAVIFVWRGWRIIHMETYAVSKTTELQNKINLLRRKYKIPKNRCIADEDGIGGGVVDNCGILGFMNGSRPIKEAGVSKAKKEHGIKRSSYESPNYKNLQVQCLYHLADKINEGGLWIMCDVADKTKQMIKEELDQIRSKVSDVGKLDCKSKSDIKMDIRRSPDFRDAILMRVFFDLKPVRKNRPISRPRGSI